MPLRRSADPFEAVLMPAGKASQRADRLTKGRMRPPADLVLRAARERRSQLERFLRALSATVIGVGTMRTAQGSVAAAIHESAVGFWVTGGDGSLSPDPGHRAGFSATDLAGLISSGGLVLDPEDPRTTALTRELTGT